MKCPNCGSHLEDGNLFCEVCGEEINIVPEYDPDVDLSVDIDGVFDHTKEINIGEVKKQKKVPKTRNEYYEKNKHVSREQVIDSVEDWDEEDPNEVGAIKDLILSVFDFWSRSIFTKIVVLFVLLLFIGFIFACILGVRKLVDRQSIDYLIEQAETSYRNKDYETAIDYYEKAIEKDPDNTEIKFAVSNCYLYDGQDNNAIFILKEIATENPALATDTYERIFNIYYENQDWKGINDLLLSCNDDEIHLL